jgi:hypothetical protein
MSTVNTAENNSDIQRLRERRAEKLREREAAVANTTAAQLNLKRLAEAQSRANHDFIAATAEHRAAAIRLADERIDGTSRDLASAVREMATAAEMVTFHHETLRHATEFRLPEARIAASRRIVELAAVDTDLATIEADLHSAEVLAACGDLARLEGHAEIKGAHSELLARKAAQAVENLARAQQALDQAVKAAEAIRMQTTGAIRYANPS